MQDEYTELIIIDDEDDGDYRNATRDHRSGRRRSPMRPRLGSGRRVLAHRPRTRVVAHGGVANGPILRRDTGGLSTGTLVEAGAQVLASIQSLPLAPLSTGEIAKDVANLMLYQAALAEHAKRDEQLRTIGSLASKLFA